MSLPDSKWHTAEGYVISAEEYVAAARREYAVGSYHIFCYLATAAAEFLANCLLRIYGIAETERKISNTYRHSIKGKYDALNENQNVTELTSDMVEDVFLMVSDFANKENSKKPDTDRDHGANIYKWTYDDVAEELCNLWPHEWVDETHAKPILETSLPAIEKLITNIRRREP